MHRFDKQFHKAVDLGLWAVPVLGAEGVEGQVFHPELHGRLDRLTHGGHRIAVAEDAFVLLLHGPTAVAIHDYCHVLRHTAAVDLFYCGHIFGL